MNSRKLRVLALLLSAIMVFTAVPSTLFAGEFGDGEVVTWDDNAVVEENEVPTDDFGSDVPVEVAAFDDGFSAEVADDVFVGAGENGIQYELWSLTDNKVRIYYLDKSYNNNLGYKDYAATEVALKDNCTRSYLTAKVDNGKGNTAYEINSNIANLDASWAVFETDKSLTSSYFSVGFDPDNTPAIKLGTAGADEDLFKYGLRTSTKYPNHVVNLESRKVIKEDRSNCEELETYYEYTCKNCTTKGYIDSEKSPILKSAFDPTATGVITFDVTPEPDFSNIGYVTSSANHVPGTATVVGYIVAEDTATASLTTGGVFTFDADGGTYWDATTKASTTTYPWTVGNASVEIVSEAKDFNIYNSEFDTAKAKAGVFAEGQDAKWIVVSKYDCVNCNKKNIYSFKEDSVLIKKKAYYLGTNAMINPAVSPAPTGTPVTADLVGYYGTKTFYDTDDAFVIADCTANNGVGTYYEVWYTENPGNVKYEKPIEHKLEKHSKKITVYTTSAVALGERSSAVADKKADLAKICKVDNNGIPTASLDCKDVNYYVVTVCNCRALKPATTDTAAVAGVWNVLECTPKVASGNGRHTMNSDAERVNTLVKAKTAPKFDDLKAAVKTTGNVVFANNTADCTKAGTVDISYICDVCGQLVPMGTFTVAKDDHHFEWVEIEPTEHATCPKDGYVTQQSQCTKCGTPEPGKKVVTAVEPKLNHKGIEKVTEYGFSMNKDGDIVGPLFKEIYKGVYINVDTTETWGRVDNMSVINAKIWKVCPLCGKEVDITTIEEDYQTPAEKVFNDSNYLNQNFEYSVDEIEENNYKCNNGKVTITATATLDGKTYSDTATYNYWKNNNAFQGNNVHTPMTQADGSVVCMICGEIIKPAKTESTTQETPSESTTKEAPVESTTEETPAESTTKETPAESTTKETPTESTTKEVPVEPTTEAPAKMPAQVTGLKVTKNSPTKKVIAVKYNAVDNADQYTVNVRTAGSKTWTKNLTDGAATTYEITGLTRGEAYDIRVAAISKGIAGPRSKHQYRWLEKVTLEKPKKVGEGAVSLTWNAADGASKYKVYYSTDKTFKTGVKTGVVKSNSAIVNELTVGATYYFKVRCYKTIDGITYTGAWSNVKSKIIKK